MEHKVVTNENTCTVHKEILSWVQNHNTPPDSVLDLWKLYQGADKVGSLWETKAMTVLYS